MEKNLNNTQTIGKKLFRLIRKILPFLAVVLIIFLIALPLGKKIAEKKEALAENQSREIAEKALTNVITMPVEPSLIREKISFPGVVKPWISLQLVSEIKGKIIDKRIMEGRRVNKGDILALIDSGDYQNAYNAALASYETALATETRLKALMKNNFATQSQFDDAEARVKTTRAELDSARLNLSRCTILSPMEGVVDRIYIENGTFLSPGDPVAQILQIDRLKIEVGIPESDVDAVRKLKVFDMTIDALAGKTCTGEYHYLYKTSDSMARLYNLEIKVDNADGQILPDMFVRVEVVKQQDPRGLAVPIYSLVTVDKKTGVFVEKEGIVHFRPVKTGFLDGWKTQVAEGLEPGEHVVVVGHRIIEDGERVRVAKTIRDMEEISQ
ncbi:MAG: efflux RND transporter periplasmic adaptor subunit [Desulfobacteraceae bacterium]|nr:efflux RND transporter periplasmic adaptor subunit [Desulfobacteraceae bacterium]